MDFIQCLDATWKSLTHVSSPHANRDLCFEDCLQSQYLVVGNNFIWLDEAYKHTAMTTKK